MSREKLYPPYIEGTIPAFSGTVITVPFSMNKAVSKSQIAGFSLKIKTVQSNTFITTLVNTNSLTWDLDDGIVTFEIPTVDDNGNPRDDIWKYFNVGQFYKIQLAYLTSETTSKTTYTTGYYSTVGVLKYTTEPEVTIAGLEYGQINNHNYRYVGHYSQQGKDTTEKLYSSKFKVFDSKGGLIEESPEILHNVTEDTEIYEGREEWILKRDLDLNRSYYIQYIVTTSNNMTVYSRKYRLMQKKTIEPELKAQFIAIPNFDEGYVDLTLQGAINEFGLEEPETGAFVISRTSEEEGNVWNEIVKFNLEAEVPSRFLWRDFTVKQGISYKYSIQQYNDSGLYSDRIFNKTYNEHGELIEAPVFVDFEDMFLFDGTRQLKIQFNPSVSSFNRIIQESKMETIGSKHPFIFRNGAIDYKEFPISGLISYLMDEAKLFLSEEEFALEEKTTNLVAHNIVAERNFKMKVFEWLTNGEPKLFRSPGEGNFIIRLLNVSLSPNATVGRMLHSFNANATEIADYTYDNLNYYGLINVNDPNLKQTRWKTINLAGYDEEFTNFLKNAVARDYFDDGTINYGSIVPDRFYEIIKEALTKKGEENPSYDGNDLSAYINPTSKEILTGFRSKKYNINVAGGASENPYGSLQKYLLSSIIYASGQINDYPVTSIYFTDMMPGSKIQLDDKIIEIGVTGTYKVENCGEIKRIIIPKGAKLQGSVTYSYESASQNLFDLVDNIEIVDVPARQFWGGWSKTYVDTSKVPFETITTRNVRDAIEDSKTKMLLLYKMHIRKRRFQTLFIRPDANPAMSRVPMFYDMDCKQPFDYEKADKYTVYNIYFGRSDYTYKLVEGELGFIDANLNRGEYYITASGEKIQASTGYLYDPIHEKIKLEQYSPKFYYNGNAVSLYETEEFILENIDIDDFKSLVLDNGVFGELTYQIRITNYSFEKENKDYPTVPGLKEQYLNALYEYTLWKETIDKGGEFSDYEISLHPEVEAQKLKNIQSFYNQLITEIDETILQYKEANAI